MELAIIGIAVFAAGARAGFRRDRFHLQRTVSHLGWVAWWGMMGLGGMTLFLCAFYSAIPRWENLAGLGFIIIAAVLYALVITAGVGMLAGLITRALVTPRHRGPGNPSGAPEPLSFRRF